ncbi:hypothetical protein ACHHYP_20150 [Achlya hypogyna]|uniref:Uncharacterized protein n=1 Tax=Achlya hypogyna TaxID=1202772 RepID=A0A1V9ZPH9_ACHHY|nr:hypothetical protein ACHHYP_20150 [Achlya hypogyna]
MYDLQVNADPTLRHVQEKRQRHREAQRRYRYLIAIEAEALEAEIPLLEARLMVLQKQAGLTPSSLVPWRDIAFALEQEATVSMETQATLRDQLQQAEHNASALAAWVQQVTQPSPLVHGGRAAAMTADTSIRNMAAEWTMQQLYHNLPILHAQAAFPTCTDEPYIHVSINELGTTYCALVHQQYELPLPTAVVLAKCQRLMGVQANKCGVEYLSGGSNNILVRTIQEKTRWIMLVQGIEDDPMMPIEGYTRSWTSWTIGQAIDADRTLLQKGFDYSGCRLHGAFVPWEESDPLIQRFRDSGVPRADWCRMYEAAYRTHYEIQVKEDMAVFMREAVEQNGH